MIKRNYSLLYLLFAVAISLNASSAFAGYATLSWDPPTTNADGSPLTDLDGYVVYYGTSSGNYTEDIDVFDVTTYTVNNLTEGLTYYFAVKAYDLSRNYSDYSNEVYKTIPQQFTLAVSKNGIGTGTVTSFPSGISCGSDCSESYLAGTVVTLSASASSSSTFTGWSGGGCSGTGQCVLTMNANKTVTANFNKTPTSITVTSPNGGDTWQAGTTQIISWAYTGNPGQSVKIKLYKGGVLKRTINTGTPVGSGGSGSYAWTIPIRQTPGKDYKIKVMSKANSSYVDFSNKFTIAPPLTVTFPNGGESIASGSNYTIIWDAHPEIVSHKLKYSLDNGVTWRLIAKDITITSYDWTVPISKKDKKKCLVKVCGYNDSCRKIGCDMSDAAFTIEGNVQLTSPNGDETLTSDIIHTITWITNATKRPIAKIKLYYTKNGGTTWERIKTFFGDDLGSYDWSVPEVNKEKTQCKVKVELKDASGNIVGQDASDSYFTIQP